MDFSKLPKLSGNHEADKPQAEPAEVTPAVAGDAPAPERAPAPAPRAGADGILSLVVGVVLMMIGRGFAEWLIATAAGKAYDTGVVWQTGTKAGQSVAYWELEGFTAVSEATVFLFGLALVVDGLVLLTLRWFPRAWAKLVFAAFLVTVLATMANAAAIVLFLTQNGPTPIWATLLTGLGVYTAWQQWQLVKEGVTP